MKYGIVAALLSASVSCQQLLHTHNLPPWWSVSRIRAAGDTDLDGRVDVVLRATDSSNWPSQVTRLRVLSGANLAPLWTIQDPNLQSASDMFGFGDANGDGRSDIVVVHSDIVRVHSGSNGVQLWALVPPQGEGWVAACAVGDHDGNGRADLAVASYGSSSGSGIITLRVRRGENGVATTSLGTFASNDARISLAAVGDLTGDGKSEIGALSSTSLHMVNGNTGAWLWSLPQPGNDSDRTTAAIDLDGDGRRELFVLRPQYAQAGVTSRVSVHVPSTGAVAMLLEGGRVTGDRVAAVGDLDHDGRQDFVAMTRQGVRALSGRDGHPLWPLPSWVPGQSLHGDLTALGDIDADGYGEFVTGLLDANATHSIHMLSSRVVAESWPVQPACGGGPFLPRLGSTRPVLGRALTVAGLDNPPGVSGLLVASFGDAPSTWLGISTCYAHFDLGTGFVVTTLTQPQWSLALPLPNLPQFAGTEFSLQSWHAGTAGPFGYDLSNGVRGRIGHP